MDFSPDKHTARAFIREGIRGEGEVMGLIEIERAPACISGGMPLFGDCVPTIQKDPVRAFIDLYEFPLTDGQRAIDRTLICRMPLRNEDYERVFYQPGTIRYHVGFEFLPLRHDDICREDKMDFDMLLATGTPIIYADWMVAALYGANENGALLGPALNPNSVGND